MSHRSSFTVSATFINLPLNQPSVNYFFKKKETYFHKLFFYNYSNNGTPSISIVPRIFLTLSGLSQANPSGNSVATSLAISKTYSGKLSPCDCVFVNSTKRISLTLICNVAFKKFKKLAKTVFSALVSVRANSLSFPIS